MMAFDTAALPTPGSVDRSDATAVRRSNGWRAGGILHQAVPDEDLDVQQWVLNYPRAHGAVLHVLEAHYDAFFATSFDWTPPGETVARRVIYREPTAIDWENEARGNATVFLEEALAH